MQRLRQRIVVVRVAVRHVAAEQDDRVVEHVAVALPHVVEALDELRKHARCGSSESSAGWRCGPGIHPSATSGGTPRGRPGSDTSACSLPRPSSASPRGCDWSATRARSSRTECRGDHRTPPADRAARRADRRAATWRWPRASARAARSRGPNRGNRSPGRGRRHRACDSGWPSRHARSRAGCPSCSEWLHVPPPCRPGRTCHRTPSADCFPSAAAAPACGTRSCRPARRTVPATAATCPCRDASRRSDPR